VKWYGIVGCGEVEAHLLHFYTIKQKQKPLMLFGEQQKQTNDPRHLLSAQYKM
jgi:hypothetical protein